MALYRKFCDEELVIFLMEGDEQAFTELYRRHWQNLFNTVYKRLQNLEQSQDIVQNIFADLWERRGQVNIENIQAYLHTAVRYQVFKHVNRQSDSCGFLNDFEEKLAASCQTDEGILENEALDLLKFWIAALPPKRREIFLLHYMEDFPTYEIASQLDISQKTVQNQLNTAAHTLRSQLKKILFFEFMALSILFD